MGKWGQFYLGVVVGAFEVPGTERKKSSRWRGTRSGRKGGRSAATNTNRTNGVEED